ncbi:MAG: hypothetical protein IPP69_16755 [Flavobacteriales bacterium]|nr:hypothetical protein [Flavobacteriales bacterium]
MHNGFETKTIYILGAGFSKSFSPGMPLLSDFKTQIIDMKMDGNGKYPRLADFANRFYQKSHLDSVREIETLATLILTKQLYTTETERQLYSGLKSEILAFIAEKISAEQSVSDSDNFKLLSSFIKHAISKKSALITFNYDLIIENSGIGIDYPGIHSYPTNILQGTLSEPLEYLKLHGSLNWYKIKGADSVGLESVRSVNSNSRFYKMHQYDVPVFIPMAHAKDSFLTGTMYSTIWSYAINKLNEANEIHFIGYGFPETDLNNLVTFLDYKEKIKTIVIHGDNNETARLAQIFGDDKVKNVDAKEFIRNHISSSI